VLVNRGLEAVRSLEPPRWQYSNTELLGKENAKELVKSVGSQDLP